MEPRVQVRIAGASGDLDSTDTKMNLFRPITTRSPINDLIPIGFANIGVFTVEGEIRIVKGLHFVLGYYSVRRLSPNDGSYTSDVTHMFREPDNNGIDKGIHVVKGVVSEVQLYCKQTFQYPFADGILCSRELCNQHRRGKNPIRCVVEGDLPVLVFLLIAD